MHYAIQDTAVGHIQYLAEADSEQAALEAFDTDVGIDPHEEGINVADWEITPITKEQHDFLTQYTGDNQVAVDYLEAIKNA